MNSVAPADDHRPRSDGAAKSWDLYSGRQRSAYLLVLFLVGTSNYVDRNIIGVLLEPIKREFGVSDTMLGLLSGLSFALFYATLGIPVARWADRGDRRFIITISLTVWSLMTVLCGMAQNFWQLALARVGVGMGEAGAIPPAQSLIADYYPPDRRAKAIGIYMMCSMAGYVIDAQGKRWSVVMLINHANATGAQAAQDALLNAVYGGNSAVTPAR
jgi:MFS family permease